MALFAPQDSRPPEETDNPGQQNIDNLVDKEFNPDDYQRRQEQPAGNPIDPRGNDTASGDSSDPRARVKEQEESPVDNQSFYRSARPSKPKSRAGKFFFGNRRRKFASGGAAGLILGAIIAFLTLLSGPLELVQLSHILQHPFAKNSSDSSNRLGRLYRYAKTGNIGETRVGRLGSNIFGKTIDQLNQIGIKIENDPLTGKPTRTSFEIDKLKAAYPELEGMGSDQIRSFISGKLNGAVTPDQIGFSDGKFIVDETGFSIKTARMLTRGTVGLLDSGWIANGVKARVLNKYFGLPSLFHPFSRALTDQLNGLTAAAREKALEDQQKQYEEELRSQVETKGDAAVKDVEDKSSSFATKYLTITGGVCVVYSTAGDIITINRDRVILPAALTATSVIAMGAQAQAGRDLSVDEVGATMKSLTGPGGKTVWQGQALDALAHNGHTNQSLADLPHDYRKVFSGDTTASSIQSAADQTILALTGGVIGAGGTFGACGLVGTAVQIVITLGISAIDTFQEVASLGTLTPEIAAQMALYWGAREAVNAGETALVLHYIQSFILGKTTAKLAADAFSGPIGGNLLAFGARESSNMVAIASGGVSLGNKASTIIAADQQQAEDQEFRSMSIAKRLFDTHNYRSAISKLVDSASPNLFQNALKFSSIFTNFGTMFSHSLSAMTAGALADTQQYNWGFPQYGLPDSVLKDPKLQNPYDNSQYVAKNILDTNLTDSHGMNYIDKAKACFGADLSNQNADNLWDAVPANDVNPSDDSYIKANCNDDDENWHRIIAFVFDTTSMKAAACYENDTQSCADIGADAGSGT